MRVRIAKIFGDVPTASEFETLLAFSAILAAFQPDEKHIAEQALALIVAIFKPCIFRPVVL
jgi:hypothetical protein